MERITDDGAAHGLRQHSIGSTYPAIVVGHPTEDGGVAYYVMFGKHRTLSMGNKAAQKAAENVAKIVRNRGWEQAMLAFTNAVIYQGEV
jgi:hypothetical protein